MNTSTDNPLNYIDPADITGAWIARGLDRIGDAELLSAACQQLSTPRNEAANSFILHAPLELMARAQLLPMVSTQHRESARQRIARIATTWSTTGAPIETAGSTEHDERPLDALTEALRHGDPETGDHAFVALCARRDQDQIIGDLVDIVLPHLGGAAHGAIFLELLPRFRPTGINPALMARTLVAEIARNPDWQIQWLDQPRPEATTDPTLTDRLVSPRAEREPSSHFVQPTMALVDDTGLAHRTLADVTQQLSIEEARGQLLPIAAMSMLQDEPTNAPYGWSHCLTLPQAALAVAHRASDTQQAVDVAATYVLGFRATQSSGPIDPSWQPDVPQGFAHEITQLDPPVAAAAAWHAEREQRVHIAQQLIDHAAPHHDAHLAKYTLACIDAGAQDPANGHLYLAAAAYLAAWWHHHDHTTGPST